MLAVTDRLDRDRVRVRGRTDRPGGRRLTALGAAFVLAGIATIPWVFYLSVTLPVSARDAHWSLAWVGLDSCEALALLATAGSCCGGTTGAC